MPVLVDGLNVVDALPDHMGGVQLYAEGLGGNSPEHLVPDLGAYGYVLAAEAEPVHHGAVLYSYEEVAALGLLADGREGLLEEGDVLGDGPVGVAAREGADHGNVHPAGQLQDLV